MSYVFTSESVSAGHPDKVADQISDALLDHFLAFDPQSKVACETLVTTGQVFLAGEVHTKTYVDVARVARDVIAKIGYTKNEYLFSADACSVLSAIHEQSPDIQQGVEKENPHNQGAGDQGTMFGYAVKETHDYMPLPISMANLLLQELDALRKSNAIDHLRPDAKAQVSVVYDAQHQAQAIDTIVLSVNHDDLRSDKKHQALFKKIIDTLLSSVKQKLDPATQALFRQDTTYLVNPTGRFVLGGPHADVGLTGRKIVVDTYGGRGAHGGGAFSGKDPSKVDRSAAYATRYLAKNLVAAGLSDEVLIQVSYAIGKADPVGFYVSTCGRSHVAASDSELTRRLRDFFSLRPANIEARLSLRKPIYLETAAYGHMGRKPQRKKKTFSNGNNPRVMDLDLFTWEALDSVTALRDLYKDLL